MRNFITGIILIVIVWNVNAQEDYMTTITQETCSCIDGITDSLSSNEITMRIGVCMLTAAKPYKKELKRDHNIDLDAMMADGQRLGEIIGLRMAGECPDVLLAMTERVMEDEDSYVNEMYEERFNETSVVYEYVYGRITSIDEGMFITFTVKETNGKTSKMYWMGVIETEQPLQSDYKSLVGKEFEIYYLEEEFYDPRLKEYRNFKVIKSIL